MIRAKPSTFGTRVLLRFFRERLKVAPYGLAGCQPLHCVL